MLIPDASWPVVTSELLQGRVGADPQGSPGTSKDGLGASRQAFGTSPAFPLIGAQPARKAGAVQANPYRSLAVLHGAGSHAHQQPVLGSDTIPASSGLPHQAVPGRHEQPAVGLQIQVAERAGFRYVVHGHELFVQPASGQQPRGTADPQIPFVIGKDGVPNILRNAVLASKYGYFPVLVFADMCVAAEPYGA